MRVDTDQNAPTNLLKIKKFPTKKLKNKVKFLQNLSMF